MNFSEGRIIFASRNLYTVLSGNTEYLSVLSGSFIREAGFVPAVGDYVDFRTDPSGSSVIEQVHPRKSVISRKTSGRAFAESVLAANVDYMLIVTAIDSNFSRRRIERFLVLAREGGVEPVIILSKADSADPIDLAVALTEAEEAAGGSGIIELSSVTGAGIDRLEDILTEGVTACAVGLSGAGKSTLLNRLAGAEVMETGGVRADDSKGKHTTTFRHMFRLPSGAMFIDTPGLREVGMLGGSEALDDVFTEIAQLSGECFYSDCTHTHEPGCAVTAAVESGKISADRYENYLKLRAESENYRIRSEDPQRKKRDDKKLSRRIKSVNKIKKRF